VYVACGVRMYLYAHMDKLGERALFCNTDSVIFVQKDGESPPVQFGDALGDMTSELKKANLSRNLLVGVLRSTLIYYPIL